MRHAVAIAVELQPHVLVNQRLDGVSIIRRDGRQTSEGIGLETIDWALSRFAVQSPIGDLIEPFTRLAVHIVEVEEIAQRPEVLPDVTDATAFHFPLLPATRLIAGTRVKVELAGNGQEARIETNQSSILFGDGGGQVVIPELSGNAVQLLKCVKMTTNKGLETLAVRELQILHPAVPVNEGEGVELPLITLVV